MQINGKYLFPIAAFLLVVLLVVLMFSTPAYVPYTRSSMYRRYASYEGMEDSPEGTNPEGDKEGNKEGDKKDKKSNSLEDILPEQFDTNNRKKEGFSPLGFAPIDSSSSIDKFSEVNESAIGNSQCFSAGLSNSKGPLCLTPELVQLLKSRGGNM